CVGFGTAETVRLPQAACFLRRDARIAHPYPGRSKKPEKRYTPASMNPQTAVGTAALAKRAAALESALKRVIRGKDEVVRLALVAILARGHLLIEGVPGVGKTTLAQALASFCPRRERSEEHTSELQSPR